MKYLEFADEDTKELCREAMEMYHDKLYAVGVRVDILLAMSDSGPAVTDHGMPCLAKIRTVPYKERVKGGGDLEIMVDKDQWATLNRRQKIATFDHELRHRELKLDKSNAIKFDDLGRPLFDRIPHAIEFGWFPDVAARHGEDSIEVVQARRMVESYDWRNCIQRFLPGLEPIDVEHAPTNEPRVTTRDGRKISIEQMVCESRELLKPARIAPPKGARKS